MNKVRHICTYFTAAAVLCLNLLTVMPLSVSAEDEPTVSESTVSEPEPEVSEDITPEPEVSEGAMSEPDASEEENYEIEPLADTEPASPAKIIGLTGDGEGVEGSEGNPYLIKKLDDLKTLAEAVSGGENCENTYFELVNSFGCEWKTLTIGNSSHPFSGKFNGRGNALSDLYYTSGGLFGNVGGDGEIFDLEVRSSISGSNGNVGGIAGVNEGKITNCNYIAFINNCSGDNVGGIAGENKGTITNCSSSGKISGSGRNIGGIAGVNEGTITNCYISRSECSNFDYSGNNAGGIAGANCGTIQYCHTSGNINGSAGNVGGIAGHNYNTGEVKECYNTCYIEGANNVGGVVGCNDNAEVWNCYNTSLIKISGGNAGGVAGSNINSGIIVNCYNIGEINDHAGGVVGTNTDSTLTDCYYLKDKSGNEIEGNGAYGITAGDFKLQGTFWSWDFGSVWKMSSYRPVFKNNAESDVGELLKSDSELDEMFNGKGTGTANDPYLINGITDLNNLQRFVNSGNTAEGRYFKLMDNIALSGYWTPIGIYDRIYTANWKPFAGIFDGNGYEIKNLRINLPDKDGVGLFGNNAGIIKNLGIRNGSVTGYNEVGSIAGYNSGTIERCYNENCNASGRDRIGGIVGNNPGIVQICYNTGTVNCSNGSCGGIAGDNGGTIENCYNTGTISGNKYVGGVVGYLSGTGEINKSYSIGYISANEDVGGVAGYNGTRTTSCFYIANRVTTNSSADKIDNNGTAILEEKFADQDFFENEEWFFNGTEYNYIWVMLENPVSGDFVRPIFGYKRYSEDSETPDEDGNVTETIPGQEGGGSGSWGYDYPWSPSGNNNNSNSDKDEDDVSSAAGVLEDSSFVESAVPVIGIVIPIAVSSIFIFKLRKRKE